MLPSNSPNSPLARIGVRLRSIGALHDGLGEFSLQIGQRIAARALEWLERTRVAIQLHLRERLFELCGTDVGYMPVTRWQRVRHVQPEPFALQHALHQLNKTLPPLDCPQRVVTVHDLNYRYGRMRQRVPRGLVDRALQVLLPWASMEPGMQPSTLVEFSVRTLDSRTLWAACQLESLMGWKHLLDPSVPAADWLRWGTATGDEPLLDCSRTPRLSRHAGDGTTTVIVAAAPMLAPLCPPHPASAE